MKEEKHRRHFHNQQKHFSPFVPSVVGILGKQDQFVLANLSQLMATKMEEPISHVSSTLRNQDTDWELG